MDPKIKEEINAAERKALSGEYPGRDFLLRMLSLDPLSPEALHFRKAGRSIAERTGNVGRVGSSIGLDLTPCAMSCSFCSLGEKWHLIENSHEISPDTVIRLIKDVKSRGFWQFTIRTTQHYDLDRLCELGKRISQEVPDIHLSANTGELSLEDAKKLRDAGFVNIYHAVRLREGTDTPIPKERRMQTIRNARKAGLNVSGGIDPIGAEHTNEELVDLMELYRTLDVGGVCTMRRSSVKGTPKGKIETVSDERLAQIAAVVRFASVGKWSNVAVHPALQIAMESGANVCAVETGANPRMEEPDTDSWTVVSQEEAKSMLEKAGYVVAWGC